MTSVEAKCHLYGKLPAHGDFVSRGLGAQQDKAIDERLTMSMEVAQSEWGADFEDTYLSAQPWLFTSQESTAIIIPSIDKVGRKFPLYLAVLKGIVLQFLYDATISAISSGNDADSLIKAIAGAPERERASQEEPEAQWFCIDAQAPRLPRLWDETCISLRGEVS